MLKLADGSLVLPTGQVISPGSAALPERAIEMPTPREVNNIQVETRKQLKDLPDNPRITNVVNVILGYSLFGLDINGIVQATKLSPDQIDRVRCSDAYRTMHSTVVGNILSAESDDIRAKFVQNAKLASEAVLDVMRSGKMADRLSAAKDVLDRGGFRPADVVEHKHSLDGALTIAIVRKDDNLVPAIDIELEEEVNG